MIVFMSTLKERLEEALKEANITKTAIWKACGISSGAVSQWFSGKVHTLEGENLLNAARVLNVNPDWLATGKGKMKLSDQNEKEEIDLDNNDDYPAIKRVNLKLSAGISGFAIDYDVEDKTPIVMQKKWFESKGYKPSKLLAVKVTGESMQDGLHDGDTVVINTEDTKPVDGVVFAVNYEGEMLIKRMVRDAGLWWLSSDNQDQRKYPRKECSGDMCLVVGRIVHKQSERI